MSAPAAPSRDVWLVRVYCHAEAGWTWNLKHLGQLLNACSGYGTEAEAMEAGERSLAREIGRR